MTQPTSIQQFISRSNDFYEAIFDGVPAWNDDVRNTADHALNGEICPSPEGEWAAFDFDNANWSSDHTWNQPHVEMAVRRFGMIRPLVSGWRATKDERYAAGARRWIETYMKDNPVDGGWDPVPGDGATQYDIRAGTFNNPGWLGALWALHDSDAFDDAFTLAVFDHVQAYVRYLEHHIWPDRNIRTLHGEVLMLTALRMPFLPEAERWMTLGVRITNDAVRRQILADGAHMEAAPGYHGVVMDLFVYFWRLARAMPELGLEIPTEKIAAMHDYAAAYTRPDGAIVPLHDTRYVVNGSTSRRSAAEAARLAFRQDAGLGDEPPATAIHFPEANQIFLRDSWDSDATYIAFDGATRRSFHWHACRNSFQLSAFGRALLVDPGYTFQNEQWPSYGGGTSHHTTINLNDWQQSEARATLRHHRVGRYDLIEGLYDGGYWKHEKYSHDEGIWGEHHRTLLWVHDRFQIVLDNVSTTAGDGSKPDINCVWQLCEGPATVDAARRRAVTQHEDANLLMLFPVTPDGAKPTLHAGETDPRRGWLVSEWGRRCIPAPMVRIHVPHYDPWQADFATVLLPFAGTSAPKVNAVGVTPHVDEPRAAGRVDLQWEDGSSDIIVWTRRLHHAIDGQHDLNTDASLVHIQRNAAGDVVGGFAVDGAYLEIDGVAVPNITWRDRLGS